MKALIVTPYFPPHIGGAENYAYNIARGLRDQFGWEIVVATSSARGAAPTALKDEFRVYHLPPWITLSNTPVNPLWPLAIRRIVSRERPDIINGHSPVPLMADAGLMARGSLPYVLTYHSGRLAKGQLATDFMLAIYERSALAFLFNRADSIVSYSPDFANRVLGRHSSKVHCIPPGVDTKAFSPGENAFRDSVLYVGRIECV